MGPPAEGHDRTEPVDIQVEMQRSYIDYAMSVIVGRAHHFGHFATSRSKIKIKTGDTERSHVSRESFR